MTLQNYKFEIVYIKGKENVLADALTRNFRISENICANLLEEQTISQEEKYEIISMIHEETGHGEIDVTYVAVLKNKKWKNLYREVEHGVKYMRLFQ